MLAEAGYALADAASLFLRRDILREAVFLCMMPFDAALSSFEIMKPAAFFASSVFLAAMSLSNFFASVLSSDFIVTLRRCFTLDFLMALYAAFLIGTFLSPHFI